MTVITEKRLKDRSGSKCEISGSDEDLVLYLDLVATAIAADIVPITGENRVLAKFGLEVINSILGLE